MIFVRNQLCRSKVYCRNVDDRQGELHDLLEKLMTKAQKLSDSSVCLYYFRYRGAATDAMQPSLVFFFFLLFSLVDKGLNKK